jgi:hypothetical protein
MAKISKTVVDKALRDEVFYDIGLSENCPPIGNFNNNYYKVNDRQYGVILKDLNGVERYVRIGAIVAEEREDMTAEELMQSEIEAYKVKQADKEAKAQARAEKAKKDKERRAKEKEAQENA